MAPQEDSTRPCLKCGKRFGARGLGNHQRACIITDERLQQNKEYEDSLEEARRTMPGASKPRLPKLQSVASIGEGKSHKGDTAHVPMPDIPNVERRKLPRLASAPGPVLGGSSKSAAQGQTAIRAGLPRLKSMPKEKGRAKTPPGASTKSLTGSMDILHEADPPTSDEEFPSLPDLPQKDDIRTTYHPNAGRKTVVKSFEDYGTEAPPRQGAHHPKPWLPFHSENEFAFAEVVLESAMSNSQVDALIKVVQNLIQGGDSFMVKDHRELETLWEGASDILAPFTARDITVLYKQQRRTLEFWSRSLMGYARNVVEDPFLGSVCEWDAIHLEKFDGQTWIPFVHEPWTASRMWNVQSKLPKDGKPLCITLYADKTQLSSFGSAQGYPIMAQIANLPDDIRNGKGLGGAQVVGWLPVVPEEESEKGTAFTNFKRAVWHASFKSLLDNIALESYTGVWVKCGDGVERKLYPFVFILAADYEEQYVG